MITRIKDTEANRIYVLCEHGKNKGMFYNMEVDHYVELDWALANGFEVMEDNPESFFPVEEIKCRLTKLDKAENLVQALLNTFELKRYSTANHRDALKKAILDLL